MKTRCTNPKASRYERYGGRGISVCDEWANSFDLFQQWALSNGYTDALSIDRIDMDGNYEPDNCRWADSKTQANNKSNVTHVFYQGNSYTLTELAEMSGLPRTAIRKRINSGWNIERTISEPLHNPI